MRAVLVGAALALVAAACWKTRPNPLYCDDAVACGDPALPTCEPTTHTCVAAGDLGVDQGGPDLARMCLSSATCTSGTARFCGADGTCRACAAGDCGGATAVCAASGALSGACVECTDEGPCKAAQKTCDAPTGTCRACANHAECGSGICDAGKCVLATDIAYVDINQTPCTVADGSAGKAYCDVNTAIATGKAYVRVMGSAMTYNAISISGTTVANVLVVGPGKTASLKAQFSQNSLPAAGFGTTAGTSTVVLDGLELIGSNVGNQAGVKCAPAGGTVNLTVRDCYIHTSGAVGIDSNACTININRNFITDNKGGINVAGGMFTIENNLIYQNSSLAVAGVTFDNASAGSFRFNTVTNNTTSTGGVAAGIACGSAGKTISNSIVVGNTKATTSQFEGTCTLDMVVTGTDSATGAIMKTPTFAGANDFHLAPGVSANADCCTNKIMSVSPALPLDVDDTLRPKSGLYDVGAHEVE